MLNLNTTTVSKWNNAGAGLDQLIPDTNETTNIIKNFKGTWSKPRPFVIAIGGHTGTGKSTLGFSLKNSCPLLKEALVLEDDAVRRKIVCVNLKTKLRPSDYCDYVSVKTTQAINAMTRDALSRGQNVINCSGFFAPESRESIQKIAEEFDAQFIGLWLVAPRKIMVDRINKRLYERDHLAMLSVEAGHASDADEGVIDKFGDIGIPASPSWQTINAASDATSLYKTALSFIEKQQMSAF